MQVAEIATCSVTSPGDDVSAVKNVVEHCRCGIKLSVVGTMLCDAVMQFGAVSQLMVSSVTQAAPNCPMLLQGTGIAAFVLALATTFKPNWAKWSAPLYAAVKGFFLGATSLFFELRYPGIAMSAVLLTFGTAGGLLALYKGNFITVSDRFRNIVVTSMVGLMVAYLGRFVLGLCGVNFAFMSGGAIGILLAGAVTALSAATLLVRNVWLCCLPGHAGGSQCQMQASAHCRQDRVPVSAFVQQLCPLTGLVGTGNRSV